MKSIVLLALLALVAVSLVPGQLEAQEATSPNWERYQAERKEEWAAVALGAFIPVVGHAYADNAAKGVPPLLLSAAGFAGMIAGAWELSGGIYLLGLTAYAGGRVWGMVSAYQTAAEYNRALRQRLQLSFAPVPDGQVGLALTYRF